MKGVKLVIGKDTGNLILVTKRDVRIKCPTPCYCSDINFKPITISSDFGFGVEQDDSVGKISTLRLMVDPISTPVSSDVIFHHKILTRTNVNSNQWFPNHPFPDGDHLCFWASESYDTDTLRCP